MTIKSVIILSVTFTNVTNTLLNRVIELCVKSTIFRKDSDLFAAAHLVPILNQFQTTDVHRCKHDVNFNASD